jgi:cobalamin biosynthesis protein CobD/CbiB
MPELARMLSRYGLKEIEGAQNLLRTIVGRQTKCLKREQLEHLSKVKKFD